MSEVQLPPGQQLIAVGKWPTIGEREPRADDAPWRLVIGGAVARPCAFTLEELQSWRQVEQTVDLHCVTRWSKLGVRFSGVPLATLLDRARPLSEARFVSFVARSDRAHSTSLVLADALDLQSLVAMAADGLPLSRERGGPLRLVVPRRYFYKSLKWLQCIELTSEDRLGFWERTSGYHNTADPWREQRYVAEGITKAEARRILQRRDISGLELCNLVADGRDLAGLMARGALLCNADFRRSSLRGACFEGANLTNAHLQGADLRDATFRNADLEGANLSNADLCGACFTGARLLAATFCESTENERTSLLLDDRTQLDFAALEELSPVQEAVVRAALIQPGQSAKESRDYR